MEAGAREPALAGRGPSLSRGRAAARRTADPTPSLEKRPPRQDCSRRRRRRSRPRQAPASPPPRRPGAGRRFARGAPSPARAAGQPGGVGPGSAPSPEAETGGGWRCSGAPAAGSCRRRGPARLHHPPRSARGAGPPARPPRAHAPSAAQVRAAPGPPRTQRRAGARSRRRSAAAQPRAPRPPPAAAQVPSFDRCPRSRPGGYPGLCCRGTLAGRDPKFGLQPPGGSAHFTVSPAGLSGGRPGGREGAATCLPRAPPSALHAPRSAGLASPGRALGEEKGFSVSRGYPGCWGASATIRNKAIRLGDGESPCLVVFSSFK